MNPTHWENHRKGSRLDGTGKTSRHCAGEGKGRLTGNIGSGNVGTTKANGP